MTIALRNAGCKTINATMSLVVSAALMSALGIPAIGTASAQSNTSMSTEVQTAYSASYPEPSANSDSSFNVQSQYHLYKPGDTVQIKGKMSSEMREETEAESVDINIADASGEIVATQSASVDAEGEYTASLSIPSDAEEGEYTADAKIEVDASLLGLISAQIVANLESSSEFVVGSSSSFEVKTDEGDQFDIEITSNSNVGAVQLMQAEKKVSFTVEGETGTTGVTQVTIPKAMLSGEMMVLIDGQVVTRGSNDVIVKSNTNTHITFEINYSHSERTIEVSGTNVVPEFPISIVIMAVAICSILGLSIAARRTRGFQGFWH